MSEETGDRFAVIKHPFAAVGRLIVASTLFAALAQEIAEHGFGPYDLPAHHVSQGSRVFVIVILTAAGWLSGPRIMLLRGRRT